MCHTLLRGDIIKSKILFTLSILFVLISLTCVCAADNQTDSIAVIETDSDFDGMLKESIDDNSSNLDNELKVSNDEDKLTEPISLSYFNSLYKKNDYKLTYDFEGSTQSKYGIEIK